MINKFVAIGRLTRDPELRYIPSGSAITSFSLALDESYKDKNGERIKKVVFTDWQVWNGSGENLCKIAHKGDLIYAEGKYSLDEWEDQEGTKRTKPRFTALIWRILSSKNTKKEESVDESVSETDEKPKSKRGRPAKTKEEKVNNVNENTENNDEKEDEEIPF